MKKHMSWKSCFTLIAVVLMFALQNCCAWANVQHAFQSKKSEKSCHHQAASSPKKSHDCCDQGPCSTLKMVDTTAKTMDVKAPQMTMINSVIQTNTDLRPRVFFERSFDESPHLPPSITLSLFPSHAPPLV